MTLISSTLPVLSFSSTHEGGICEFASRNRSDERIRLAICASRATALSAAGVKGTSTNG